MDDAEREPWQLLAEQAAGEQDPQRLLRLVQELNRLLEERQGQPINAQVWNPSQTKSNAAGETGDNPCDSTSSDEC